ncbi:MAG: protein kinase domain-containing protein [Thermoanaerobaculia bacterium]
MTPRERYERIKALYLEARDLSAPAERVRFLAARCGDDPDLLREVDELLGLDSGVSPGAAPELGLDPPPEPPAEPPIPAGTRVGPYEVEEEIARGGMGHVYRARDVRLDRRVALKFLARSPASEAPAEEASRRFLEEARTASALDHPNVCTIHDVGAWRGRTFLAMTYYPGRTLQDRLAEGPLPVDEAVHVAVQVARGLAAAHAEGIVHRDVKPGNVLLSEGGPVKVLDFGLASHPGRRRLTRTGLALGTPGFMAPEQLRGERASPAADVWAVGVLLYEMLTGRHPFRGDSLPAAAYAAVHEEPEDLRRSRPETPAWLAAVVTRCLAKDPARRFPDAGRLHRALSDGLDGPDGTSRRGAGSDRTAGGPGEARGRGPLGRWLRRPAVSAAWALAALALLAAVLAPWWRQETTRRWLHREALPEIRRLAQDDVAAAFRLAHRARERAGGDPQLEQLWRDMTLPVTLTSEPPGAAVAVRGYREAEGDWLSLGRTPLHGVRLPLAMVRLRATLDGHVPVEAAPSLLPEPEPIVLHTPEATPEGMVAVPAGAVTYLGRPVELPRFWIDRHEVTHGEYRQFVEAGGYERPELWRHPIVEDGRVLPWEEAMERFVDSTGLPGPATWSLGTFPEGAEDHPVEGVSWYEAAAYAELVGKRLPTVFHWRRAAGLGTRQAAAFSGILRASRFNARGTAAVGSGGGLGPYGTYDMAGNVKEWCANPAGGMRYVLGGAWHEAPYRFLDADARDPLQRRPGFGFRLVLQDEPPDPELLEEILPPAEAVPEPVDDAAYAGLARRFDYDPAPLAARTESVDDGHEAWRREVVSFDAAYPGERVIAHLFLPKRGRPPYQAVVHYPGGDAAMLASSRDAGLLHVEPFLRSGRAVVYPVYRGTFERRLPGELGPVARGELLVQQIKDLRRTLDYLETRDDLDRERLAFHGLSYGAYRAPFALAVEDRFRAALVLSGGLVHQGQPPELQQQNYLPRVTLPVLLVTGREDFIFRYEEAQLPFFELLGTPEAEKRHVVVEGGHISPHHGEVVRELLAWLDRWLGPVG